MMSSLSKPGKAWPLVCFPSLTVSTDLVSLLEQDKLSVLVVWSMSWAQRIHCHCRAHSWCQNSYKQSSCGMSEPQTHRGGSGHCGVHHALHRQPEAGVLCGVLLSMRPAVQELCVVLLPESNRTLLAVGNENVVIEHEDWWPAFLRRWNQSVPVTAVWAHWWCYQGRCPSVALIHSHRGCDAFPVPVSLLRHCRERWEGSKLRQHFNILSLIFMNLRLMTGSKYAQLPSVVRLFICCWCIELIFSS